MSGNPSCCSTVLPLNTNECEITAEPETASTAIQRRGARQARDIPLCRTTEYPVIEQIRDGAANNDLAPASAQRDLP